MNLVATQHLTRRIGAVVLVDDISVEVPAGDVLAVVGPSGSGKSSFLRLLNRLDEPTSGTVFLENVDYRQILPCELRRKVGMVSQRAFLFPGTVYDNGAALRAIRTDRMPINVVGVVLVAYRMATWMRVRFACLCGSRANRCSRSFDRGVLNLMFAAVSRFQLHAPTEACYGSSQQCLA